MTELKVKIEILTGKSGIAIVSPVDKEQNFSFTDNLTLEGLKIKEVGVTRVTDRNGEVRTDCFGLQLKRKRDIENFREGQIVEFKDGI
jgi:hypothetical protein